MSSVCRVVLLLKFECCVVVKILINVCTVATCSYIYLLVNYASIYVYAIFGSAVIV